jgi:hypothetical protein
MRVLDMGCGRCLSSVDVQTVDVMPDGWPANGIVARLTRSSGYMQYRGDRHESKVARQRRR